VSRWGDVELHVIMMMSQMRNQIKHDSLGWSLVKEDEKYASKGVGEDNQAEDKVRRKKSAPRVSHLKAAQDE